MLNLAYPTVWNATLFTFLILSLVSELLQYKNFISKLPDFSAAVIVISVVGVGALVAVRRWVQVPIAKGDESRALVTRQKRRKTRDVFLSWAIFKKRFARPRARTKSTRVLVFYFLCCCCCRCSVCGMERETRGGRGEGLMARRHLWCRLNLNQRQGAVAGGNGRWRRRQESGVCASNLDSAEQNERNGKMGR